MGMSSRVFLALALWLLLPASLRAQVAVSEPIVEISSTANAGTYAFGSFTPTANAALVILAYGSGTVGVGSVSNTCSCLSDWTRFATTTYNAGADTAYAYIARANSSTSASVITVSTGADNATGMVAAIFSITGQEGMYIRQFKTSATTAANPTVTLDIALDTNSAYAAGFGMPRNPPTSTAPASWTETMDAGQGTPAQGAAAAFRAGGETGTTITFTSASAAYGMLAVEVYMLGDIPPPLDPVGVSGMFGM